MKLTTPTPASFPTCAIQLSEDASSSNPSFSLISLLQSIQRPSDVKLQHLEALKVIVVTDASPEQLIPDAACIAPVNDWSSLSASDMALINRSFRRTMSNGNLSPTIQTYIERHKELSLDNTAAFRTIRRIPPPSGEAGVRLGNGYEFFKHLDLMSGYWHDTSLPPEPSPSSPTSEKITPPQSSQPNHLRTHQQLGLPSQLPSETRHQLLTALVKLVAYDFSCTVGFPRVEPRLYLNPLPASALTPPSYFPSACVFISKIPTNSIDARSGVLEGPVGALSCRTTTSFNSPLDSNLDFAREMLAVLLTAQYRARDRKTAKKHWVGKWWAEKARWGGAPGGPIGREADAIFEESPAVKPASGSGGETLTTSTATSTLAKSIEKENASLVTDLKRAITTSPPPSSSPSSAGNATSSPLPSLKRTKRNSKSGLLPMYETYRKMLPPSLNWDRKMRYSPIGRAVGQDYDDIFLVSALNHHVSILRARVPMNLVGLFDGGIDQHGIAWKEGELYGWEKCEVWRSKWFDLFKADERLQVMRLIWGMMAFMMRQIGGSSEIEKDEEGEGKGRLVNDGGASGKSGACTLLGADTGAGAGAGAGVSGSSGADSTHAGSAPSSLASATTPASNLVEKMLLS